MQSLISDEKLRQNYINGNISRNHINKNKIYLCSMIMTITINALFFILLILLFIMSLIVKNITINSLK